MDQSISNTPKVYPQLKAIAKEIGFTMSSDRYIGSLLKTLVASKLNANILELGTGMSLTLAWMVEGLDSASKLTSIDNNLQLIGIAREFFGQDERVNLICADAAEWILNYSGDDFDLIFADTWSGKYDTLDETLTLLKVGGIYVVDDMNQQPNWPDDHHLKVKKLIASLEARKDLIVTKMNWSTGIILCTKKQ